MSRRKAAFLALAIALSSATDARASAGGSSPPDGAAIEQSARSAYTEGKYTFCTDPARPLGARQQGLCELGAEIDGCRGYQKACNYAELPKDRSWLERLVELLAPVAKVLLYVLVLVIVVLIAIPVISAILKRRRERKLKPGEAETPNRAQLVAPVPAPVEQISDAEAALRLAEEHRARGELRQALGYYLAASLAALDHRGALRIARHRTNGEYVRSCQEGESRPPLREIVREVDRVEFGGAPPTDEAIARVSGRAHAIVRVATSTLAVIVIALFGLGCGSHRRGADPAGDELPIEVLERNGFKVASLGKSLATMPIPEGDAAAEMPVVIVDVEKVPLEEESQAHMMRWVEAGGVLVLLGHLGGWPDELKAVSITADTRDLVVRTRAGERESDEDDAPVSRSRAVEVKGARAARREAFNWKAPPANVEIEPVAFLGKETYASRRRVGKGSVLGVANDDLFTNVGMMPAHNAAALVSLLRSVARPPSRQDPFSTSPPSAKIELRVARMEDGVPPPSNPFAALMAAGLGKGTLHALAAAVLLFLAYGIRHARPRTPERKERRAFAEHIEATAAVYGRTRAYGHALVAYGRFFEARLREHVPHGSDAISFLASRSGADPDRVAELYGRATGAKDDDAPRGDELAVIEELRRMLEKAVGPGRGSE